MPREEKLAYATGEQGFIIVSCVHALWYCFTPLWKEIWIQVFC